MKEEMKKGLSGRQILLIVLTIFILGPLVFMGACFPVGFIGALTTSSILLALNIFYLILIPVCIALAFFVCYKIIKRITIK